MLGIADPTDGTYPTWPTARKVTLIMSEVYYKVVPPCGLAISTSTTVLPVASHRTTLGILGSNRSSPLHSP